MDGGKLPLRFYVYSMMVSYLKAKTKLDKPGDFSVAEIAFTIGFLLLSELFQSPSG